jgi:hypothetical protein
MESNGGAESFNGVGERFSPYVEAGGVDVDGEGDTPLALPFNACLAAFSASRFCFEDEGGIEG